MEDTVLETVADTEDSPVVSCPVEVISLSAAAETLELPDSRTPEPDFVSSAVAEIDASCALRSTASSCISAT